MSKARLAAFGGFSAAALVAVSVAAAGHRAQTTQQAAASFGATAVSHNRTTTCVASDGTYQNTSATYTGATTGASDPRLGGTLVIRAHSVLNTTTGYGWLEGSFRIRSDGGARGTIHAAIAGGKAIGELTGTVNHPAGKLVASFASGFTPAGGFDSGELGPGSASGAGTIFSHGACTQARHQVFNAVSQFTLGGREAVPPNDGVKGAAAASLTLDVTRDSSGAIVSAHAVFYVNYRFKGSVTITHLALYQGARGTNGASVLDAGIGSSTDEDGHGNLTQSVGVSPSVAQSLLASPHDYYVQLDTSAGSLRHQLNGFRRK
jgi:hypothetical protein